jgi:hypothetical protein
MVNSGASVLACCAHNNMQRHQVIFLRMRGARAWGIGPTKQTFRPFLGGDPTRRLSQPVVE